MRILDKEEHTACLKFMEDIACTIMIESVKNIAEIEETQEFITKRDSRAVGLAAGQVVLDNVINATKDMTKEQVVRWLAQTTAHGMIVTINNNPAYRGRIKMLINK